MNPSLQLKRAVFRKTLSQSLRTSAKRVMNSSLRSNQAICFTFEHFYRSPRPNRAISFNHFYPSLRLEWAICFKPDLCKRGHVDNMRMLRGVATVGGLVVVAGFAAWTIRMRSEYERDGVLGRSLVQFVVSRFSAGKHPREILQGPYYSVRSRCEAAG
jgi:hypothetical protein